MRHDHTNPVNLTHTITTPPALAGRRGSVTQTTKASLAVLTSSPLELVPLSTDKSRRVAKALAVPNMEMPLIQEEEGRSQAMIMVHIAQMEINKSLHRKRSPLIGAEVLHIRHLITL